MPIIWPLLGGRPAVEVFLNQPRSGHRESRLLLADTGAGSCDGQFELILNEEDCLFFSVRLGEMVRLGGAYSGSFRTYSIAIEIPALEFSHHVAAVGVDRTPPSFGGIAGFRFLNRFTYGNFGDPTQFGLELPD